MKAIRINAPGKVEICEIEKPVRKKGEALLKLLYGGICGSDLGSSEEPLYILTIQGFRDMSLVRKL